MKKMIMVSILLFASGMANAGFFDSIFGSKEAVAEARSNQTPEAVEAVSTPSALEAATDVAMGLMPTLTQQLNISDAQAEGGLGALMQVAQSTLSSGEFSELSQGVPGMESLLAAAPVMGQKSALGGLSGMLSGAGGIAGAVGSIGQLTGQFEALGLSADMISKFATIAMEYFSGNGDNTAELLQKGLAAVLS